MTRAIELKIRPGRGRRRRRRAGFTVIELTVTLILLGMLMTLLVPILGQLQKLQRESRRRVAAMQMIDNLMERLTVKPYEALTRSAADDLKLPDQELASFPEADLEVTVTETGDDLNAKRITITLTWLDGDGVEVAPAKLVSFVYPTGGTP